MCTAVKEKLFVVHTRKKSCQEIVLENLFVCTELKCGAWMLLKLCGTINCKAC